MQERYSEEQAMGLNRESAKEEKECRTDAIELRNKNTNNAEHTH